MKGWSYCPSAQLSQDSEHHYSKSSRRCLTSGVSALLTVSPSLLLASCYQLCPKRQLRRGKEANNKQTKPRLSWEHFMQN